MTGEAPVTETREISLSSGIIRVLGRVGVGRGVPGNNPHREILLDFGRKVAEGLPDVVMNDPEVKKTSLVDDDGGEFGAAGTAAEVGTKVA